jgi:hypothetical protein
VRLALCISRSHWLVDRSWRWPTRQTSHKIINKSFLLSRLSESVMEKHVCKIWGLCIEADNLLHPLISHNTGQKHPIRIFSVDALCDRVTVLAHNFMRDCPVSIRKFLRSFILYLSCRLHYHNMVLIGLQVSKPVLNFSTSYLRVEL